MDTPVVYATPNPPTPGRPVIFNPAVCNGCNTCAAVCPEDVFIPNPVKGESPIILHPEECWYCGVCVDDCNHGGGIRLNHPLQQRVRWKRKATGEHFRMR
ncbi:MAG: ferredoxin family protein [Acidobacteriia bacterium]|nr:ferredoxin family protein [Terriglobia bacterium]